MQRTLKNKMSKEQDDLETFEEANRSLLFLYFTLVELVLTFIAFARTATQEKILILQLNSFLNKHKNKYEIHSSVKAYSKTIRMVPNRAQSGLITS